MDTPHPRRAGLDAHKDTVVACVRHAAGGGGGGRPREEVRTFGATTAD